MFNVITKATWEIKNNIKIAKTVDGAAVVTYGDTKVLYSYKGVTLLKMIFPINRQSTYSIYSVGQIPGGYL